MGLFLFAKQIVDMLYEYKFLDYIMVGILLVMLVYQIMLVRPNIKEMFTKSDGIIVALCGLLTFTFLKETSEYEVYFKILSAFFMYFVGRIYYERIQECYGALVGSSYLVVYLNFFTRILNTKGSIWQVSNAGGDLYYYDTDMAFAMILALVFIAMFGKNSILKIVTIFLVCPYMVFWSDAGIQKLLLLVIIGIIMIYIMELVVRNHKMGNILLVSLVIGIVGVIILLYLPVMGADNSEFLSQIFSKSLLNYENMYSRYTAWKEVIDIVEEKGILGKVLGNSLWIGIEGGVQIESLYIKIYYSIGWVGLILSLILLAIATKYIILVQDRKTFYLMIMMVILLLGSGVTINSMERVQMSWFPMMFAGMVVSSVKCSQEMYQRRRKIHAGYYNRNNKTG